MLLFILNLFAFCTFNVCVWSMSWTTSNTPIPALSRTKRAFIAYYNDTVQIFGGYYTKYDIITFPLDLSSISTTTTAEFGYQFAQSSIQIKHQLWMLPDAKMTLNVFDLITQRITQTISYLGIAHTVRCVTSCYDNYIIVLGGYQELSLNYAQTEFHIYNIRNRLWSVGTALKSKRAGHSCNVVNSELFVVGGVSHSYLDIVDVLDINQSFSGSWTRMTDTLSQRRTGHRSIVFADNIYVIGGVSDHYVSQVDIINTFAKTISSPVANALDFEGNAGGTSDGIAAIEISGNIYCFGGFQNSEYYQWTGTSAPTNAPSNAPTNAPSNASPDPTKYPSNYPTKNPTKNPSNYPTKNPSNYPTKNPTKYPSNYPTNNDGTIEKENQNTWHFLRIIIIAVVGIVCACALVIICVYKKNKRVTIDGFGYVETDKIDQPNAQFQENEEMQRLDYHGTLGIDANSVSMVQRDSFNDQE